MSGLDAPLSHSSIGEAVSVFGEVQSLLKLQAGVPGLASYSVATSQCFICSYTALLLNRSRWPVP
jgi:hypothetical protein